MASLDENRYTTVLLQGSGTYCVEATLGAAVQEMAKLLSIVNGVYGKRMAQIADYYRLDYVLVLLHETEPITAQVVANALQQHPNIIHLSMVHSETTTGILNPVQAIGWMTKGKGITFLVDVMSRFGDIPVDIEDGGIDFGVSSANKCIQRGPGFGFIIAEKEKRMACKGVARSLSLDIYAQWETMEKGGGKWRFHFPDACGAGPLPSDEGIGAGGIVARISATKKTTGYWWMVCAAWDTRCCCWMRGRGRLLFLFVTPIRIFSLRFFMKNSNEKGL